MRRGARYLLCATGGIAAGIGVALHQARTEPRTIALGAWTMSVPETAHATARERAASAVRDPLALPAGDVRVLRRGVDDGGRPLDGRCDYRLEGGALSAQAWTLTREGRKHAATVLARTEPVRLRWQQDVPRGSTAAGFVRLTLRLYRPLGIPAADTLPHVTRQACA